MHIQMQENVAEDLWSGQIPPGKRPLSDALSFAPAVKSPHVKCTQMNIAVDLSGSGLQAP